MIDFIQ